MNTIKAEVTVIKHKFTDTNLEGKKCRGGVFITTAQFDYNGQIQEIFFEDVGIRKDGELVSGEYNVDDSLFVPNEMIVKANEKKSKHSISDVLGLMAICTFGIAFVVLIVLMCNKVELSYYIFLGLIVISSIAIGIWQFVNAIHKTNKYCSRNTIEVVAEITSFLEEDYINDSLKNSREIINNEDLQYLPFFKNENPLYGRGNFNIQERGVDRFFRPYFSYEYENTYYNRPALQRFLFDELQSKELYIGKKIKIFINKKDKSIYVPIEQSNTINIVSGIILLFVGLIFGGIFIYLLINGITSFL